MYNLIKRLAASDLTVLITGETGTGKEVAARTIHALSARRAGPFVAVNCAALAPGLLESELFGHEKGAFTGALQARPGRFELANGGTLLLDEIGELDFSLQPKLLRVLQDRTVERVGSSRPVAIDVRVIATTNRDLGEEEKRGRFRRDLYHRLNVLPIRMPPLRERGTEIPVLLEHFLAKHGKRMAADAIERLCIYDWPGNVRELEHLAERLCLMAGGAEIMLQDLPQAIRDSAPTAGVAGDLTLKAAVDGTERRHIHEILGLTRWNKTQAARILDISRTTLLIKIAIYGLTQSTENGVNSKPGGRSAQSLDVMSNDCANRATV